MKRNFAALLAERLTRPKPGLKAQQKMSVSPRKGDRNYIEVENQSKKAAVLLLLFYQDNDWYLVLTSRTDKVEAHRSQISFPGGRQEPGESLAQTALRETHEELGVDPQEVKIVGQLTPLYIPVSNYCIYPFVGVMMKEPQFFPSKLEVAEIIEMPLDELFLPESKGSEYRLIRGHPTLIPYYRTGAHKIWGATAMVLAEFEELLKDISQEFFPNKAK